MTVPTWAWILALAIMFACYLSADYRARLALRRAEAAERRAMGDLQDGTWYRLNGGTLTPGRISCPECGTVDINDGDPEGACACVNGHHFWDTNAPEWRALRQVRT